MPTNMAKKDNPPRDAAKEKPTPENTPVPGGGSWRWSDTLPGWVESTPDQPLQPGDTGALQTDTPKE